MNTHTKTNIILTEMKQYKEEFDKLLEQQFNADPKNLAAYGIEEDEIETAVLIKDAMATTGKRIRPYLLRTWHKSDGGTENTRDAEMLIELIHTATLIIDDVQDRSTLRRGQPCFRIIHGDAIAINTGVLMLFMAMTKAQSMKNTTIATLVSKRIQELALGQGKDVLWEKNRTVTTHIERYEDMCKQKTGSLFALAIEMADSLAEKTTQSKELVETMGVIFQLADDIANVDPDKQLGKDFAEDVKNRKPTAVLLAARHHDEIAFDALYNHAHFGSIEAAKLLSLVQQHGIPFVRARVEVLAKEAEQMITKSTCSESQKDILRSMLTLFQA